MIVNIDFFEIKLMQTSIIPFPYCVLIIILNCLIAITIYIYIFDIVAESTKSIINPVKL